MNRFVTGVRGANRFGLMLLAGAFLVGPAFLDSALPGLAGQLRAEPAPAPAPAQNPQSDGRLAEVIAGDWRSAEAKTRDVHRHPAETLQFFGLRDDMTVVELSPGGGWYMEILAPYLKERGGYYAAGFARDSKSDYAQRMLKRLDDKIAAAPELYGKVKVTELTAPAETGIAPAGSADLVLTFRNVHNWMASGDLPVILANVHRALKPGGLFGVVEHRADPAAPVDEKAKSGYVNEAHLIALVEKAGFKLEAKSEVNANPRDSRDHPKGVWTLPPGYALGDQDRAKYQAIGESDRMTLRFRKL